MKAIVLNEYGSAENLLLTEVPKPIVKEKEILVKIHATAINAGDSFSMRGSPWVVRFMAGFPKPKKNYILGWDMAGTVEETGAQVTRFKPGDEVYASSSGTFAEYAVVEEDKAEFKPSTLSFEQAAAVPTAGVTALHALRNTGKDLAGKKVLINGASGGVGSFAVQIGKMLGAEVTGVCSTKNVEMVRSLGADHVIDYTREDFSKNEGEYDFILDNVANRSLSDLKRALSPNGIIQPNSGHGGMGYVVKVFFLGFFSSKIGSMFVSNPNGKDLNELKGLIEAGKLRPVIEKEYSLEKAPEALAYQDTGHVAGKLVINVR